MRKNILVMSVSLIITGLFIGLAVMPITAGDTTAFDTKEAVINEVEKETATEGEGVAAPAIAQPPDGTPPPCNECALAVLWAASDTMPERAAAISAFVQVILDIPTYDNIIEFNDAIAGWIMNYKIDVITAMIAKLDEYNFNLGVADAVDAGFEAMKLLAEKLFEEFDELNFPVITTFITVTQMTLLFVIISGMTLLLHCFEGMFNQEQSAPASTENTMIVGSTASQSTAAGSASL